jgi:signal peptidase II
MQAAGRASLSDASAESGPSEAPHRRTVVLLVVATLVYLADQLTKVIAVQTLSERMPIELFGGLLTLRLVRNPGAAFGLAGGATVLFSAVALVVVVAVLRTARRLYSLPWALALGLLLGGAVGNLTDRILRAPGVLRGHVVDYLELPNWPVFNVADMAIVGAAALMVLLSLRGHQLEGSRTATDGR